jgi:hypothetical protein
VDATGVAYRLGHTPDAALGIASYAVTLGMAAVRGPNRSTERPWLPLAVLAKTLMDAAGVQLLTAEPATRHRRF